MTDIGPVGFAAVDDEGRRFPCMCHTEPTFWQLLRYRPMPDGKTLVVTLRIPAPLVDLRSHLENMVVTMQEALDTYEGQSTPTQCCAACGVLVYEADPEAWAPARHRDLCGNIRHGWRWTVNANLMGHL